MGWPRRRRAQQQQLRRQVSKESLALALKADPLTATSSSSSLLLSLKPQQLERAVAKWFDSASPHKTTTAPATGGLHRHHGLREKFYSVDSYAETEPEDDDEDDDEEEDDTESEGSENGTPHCPQHQHQHQHQSQPHVAFKPEPVIPEEKESEPELNETTDDEEEEEEDGYSSSDSKPPTPKPSPATSTAVVVSAETELTGREDEAAPATKLSPNGTAPVQDGVPVSTSSVQFEVIGVTVDSDDTESEDEAALENSSIVVPTTEEGDMGSDFVAAKSPIVELEEDVPSATTSLQEPSTETREVPSQHSPFLFPPPYFPGDLDEYESDIYETLLRREKVHHATTDYFSFQPHVTLVMRSMLIDWLVEVHHHFNLQPDTLYLTVNYIDRFLAAVPVKRENFQLVALTALLVRTLCHAYLTVSSSPIQTHDSLSLAFVALFHFPDRVKV